MPQYTVKLAGGGSMTVNASSPQAARDNVNAQNTSGDSATSAGSDVYQGGHQTTTSNGTTSYNPNAYVGAGEQGWAQNGGAPAAQNPSGNSGMLNPDTGQPMTNAEVQAFFQQTAGQKLAEQKREFDADLAAKVAQWQAIGVPQTEINRRTEQAQEEQFAQQLQMAQQLQQANLTGMYGGNPTETAREFNATNSLQQGRLGLDYATQAATFAASNPFQLSDFMRGAAQNGNVPTYLQNLQNNTVQGSGSTVGPNPSNAIRMGDITGNLAAGGQGYQQTSPAQQAINGIYTRGPNQLAPGTLESLQPGELTNLQQGINQQYGSAAGPAFLQAYQDNPTRRQAATQTGVLAN